MNLRWPIAAAVLFCIYIAISTSTRTAERRETATSTFRMCIDRVDQNSDTYPDAVDACRKAVAMILKEEN
ncbi:hypothetical protein ZY76_02820 [Salmonella enterica subsp. enterica serovar Infantis]|nr:hypothetical protein [Salmonella enterica subsp. enterica serovar Infantis]